MRSKTRFVALSSIATVVVVVSAVFLYGQRHLLLNSSPSGLADAVYPYPLAITLWPQPGRYKLFIMYQQSLGMLQHTLASAVAVFEGDVGVIDSSRKQEAAEYITRSGLNVSVYSAGFETSFPEMHNLAAVISMQEGLEFFFWMHSDSLLVPASTTEPTGSKLVDRAFKHINTLTTPWAVLFTNYDNLAIFNPKAIMAAPWDENILQNYLSECDSYHRWRLLKGWHVGDLPSYEEEVHVLHIAGFPNQSWHEIEPSQRLKTYAPFSKTYSNITNDRRWKDVTRDRRTSVAAHIRQRAGKMYYRTKWGKGAGPAGQSCKLVGTPRFDVEPMDPMYVKLSFIGHARGGGR